MLALDMHSSSSRKEVGGGYMLTVIVSLLVSTELFVRLSVSQSLSQAALLPTYTHKHAQNVSSVSVYVCSE